MQGWMFLRIGMSPSKKSFKVSSLQAALAASIALSTLFACHRAPIASPAAQPNSPAAPAPMGSSTSNMELARQVRLLQATWERQVSSPTPKERALALARLHFTHRRFIEVAQGCAEVVRHDPTHLAARNLLARSLHLLGNSDQALHHLDFILTKHADKPLEVLDALFLLGAIALQDPHPTRDKLVKGKAAWEGYLKLAKTGQHRDSIQQGLRSLDKRLRQLNKKHSESVQTQFTESKPPIAVPNKSFAHLKNNGLRAFAAGDLAAAQQALQQAISLRNDAEASTVLGRVLLRLSQIEDAAKQFTLAVKQNPRYAPGWHYQGMIHIMNGNPRQAIVSWQRVLQLDPAYSAHFELPQRIAVARGMIKHSPQSE